MSKDMITYILKEIEELVKRPCEDSERITYFLNQIKKCIMVPCDCGICRGTRYYYDRVLLGHFFNELCDCFDLYEHMIEEIKTYDYIGDKFIQMESRYGVKRYRAACKNQGWFVCKRCHGNCLISDLHFCFENREGPYCSDCASIVEKENDGI